MRALRRSNRPSPRKLKLWSTESTSCGGWKHWLFTKALCVQLEASCLLRVGSCGHRVMPSLYMSVTLILHSTPHSYLSALSFALTDSSISKEFAEKNPCTSHIAAGHVPK
ncbi:uncharacterized protein BJ212DRAFT_1313497 [Suillus subaureus]|uniref:Uncharacterized protein n=1 Tax=Suillus subaureus TaxID=48587 RepID=A0A9P7EPK1_9AGAM|nr:uncharacterized protein BJ212DRAFT_1313497 [Suillus subaureus]KAG1827610.1 hypothetical protein BJ212DRAFT_1313497 [Suillus subaureus]